MLIILLAHRISPFADIHVDIRPFGYAQLSWSGKYVGDDLQIQPGYDSHSWILIDELKELSNLDWIGQGRAVFHFQRFQGTLEITKRVAFSDIRSHGIFEALREIRSDLFGYTGAAFFNRAQQG